MLLKKLYMEYFIFQDGFFCCFFFNLEKIRSGFLGILKINLVKIIRDKYFGRKDIYF